MEHLETSFLQWHFIFLIFGSWFSFGQSLFLKIQNQINVTICCSLIKVIFLFMFNLLFGGVLSVFYIILYYLPLSFLRFEASQRQVLKSIFYFWIISSKTLSLLESWICSLLNLLLLNLQCGICLLHYFPELEPLLPGT
jgi:hypothetical protein